MKKLLVCSFSGGRTSAFMAQYLIKSNKYKDYKIIFVFANTGKENEETLNFVNKCDIEWNLNIVWLEASIINKKGKGTTYKIVNFKNASRNGEPFEDMLKKYPLPTPFASNCTRELKLQPINKYIKDLGYDDFITAIGIRYDERHRKSIKAKENKLIYPLCDDLQIDNNFIRKYWDMQSFDLKLKDYEGNCDLCFKKSLRKRMTLIKENKNIADWWINMENKYGNYKAPRFDLRNNISVNDIVNKSNDPFVLVNDKHELDKKQIKMFNTDLDYETDCFCKVS